MVHQPEPWDPWESAFFLGLILLKVVGTLSFPPLGLVSLLGGLAWLAFESAQRGHGQNPEVLVPESYRHHPPHEENSP
jgi:hypothetical protein